MYYSILRSTLMSYVLVSVMFSIMKASIHSEATNIRQGEVNTTCGVVRGKTINLPTGKQIVQFLGIPYANAGRFERPKPPSVWNVTLEATKYGKSCPQLDNVPPYNVSPKDTSEDCLNLNVFAPNTTAFQGQSATNPVLVWLHGGGFIVGTSAITDPSTIATRGNIIVVTVNYRLGALGFLSLKEEGLSGNYALLDVIEALRWVQSNIKSFGGDPNNVTLGGWSAGARLVGVLMMSPYANKLYERVLMMSGSAESLYSYLDQGEADIRARYFGGLLRCPHPSSDFKDCLKRKSPAQFIEAQSKTHPYALLAQWAPVVDGDVLPDSPPKLLVQGKFNGSSVLTGVANDDGSGFLYDLPGVNSGVDVTKGLTREVFEQVIGNKTWIRNQDNKVPPIIAFQYTDWSKPNDVNMTRRQYLDLLTDSIYRAPAIHSANAFAKKIPVFFYETEYREDNDVNGKPNPTWMNVAHRADLRYIFPKPTSVVSGFTVTMMEPWINFIKSGTPNFPTQQSWPRYTIAGQQYQVLKGFPAPASKLRVQKMNFWNEFMPKNGMAEATTPAPTTSPTDDYDDLSIALIVVSFFLGFFFILVIIFIIVLYARSYEHTPPSTSASYPKPQPKESTTSKEEAKYHSTPYAQSPPYESSGPYRYGNSSTFPEKQDFPPPSSPVYNGDYYDGKIHVVEERDSPNKVYMDSDML